MGGAPLLLALAAVTVDYGWQPDDKGGIEYIIQIPAGQLEQSGGFTSRIDPRVRGLVSRVVVRIGDGPLPQDFGDLAPNSAPADLTLMPGAIQQVTETQVRQSPEPGTVVRGQSGTQAGSGYNFPTQMNTAPQGGQNTAQNSSNARPSTNTFNSDNANRSQTGANSNQPSAQNFRNPAEENAQQQSAAQQHSAAAQQQANANSTYRDSSWQSNPQQGQRPSTAPFVASNNNNNTSGGAASNQQSNANFNTGTDNRNNQGNFPLSTFANPNLYQNNPTNVAGASTNQNAQNQFAQQQNAGTNLQTANPNQQDFNQQLYNQQLYNQQQAQQNGYAGNQSVGPLRNGYGTENAGNNPSIGNNGLGQAALPNTGYQNPGYNPNANQSPSGLGAPQYLQDAYGRQTDPRLLIAANGGQFGGSIRDPLPRSDTEEKAAALLIAERERLSTQALELRRENDTLAKAKEALLYDNNTLIAENRVTKDRLQSMSFFQFFLMVSFLANLYLIVHLSKLYQRYRDLVTTVRASTAKTQLV